MRTRRAPMFVLWLAMAVAVAVLVTEALPARPGNAEPAGFGAVRPVAPPPVIDRGPLPAFAYAAGVRVHLPSEESVAHFHEAYSRASLPMAPYGRLLRSENPRFRPPSEPQPGRRYVVMRSRGRGTASTSAVDVVAPAGETLYAPVTGTVTAVRSYWLYGRFPDVRVEIQPAGAPGVRVVMIHLERIVHVSVGQRVVVSQTPIGRPRVLPFNSQTDTYTHSHDPHVHIEIKRV